MEFFELCETDPQVQCSYCLSCWAEGNVYCTCGNCLAHTEEMQRRNTKKFDLMSIPNFLIKKRVGHGAWEIRRSTSLFQVQKRVEVKTLQASWNDFQRDIQYIENHRKILFGRKPKPHAKKWTRRHKKISYTLTKAERLRYKSNWLFALNSSRKKSGPLASRPVFRPAFVLKDHLCRDSEDYQPPIPPQDQDRLRKDNTFSETSRQGSRVDKTMVWKFWPSSSSSSTGWQSDTWDW